MNPKESAPIASVTTHAPGTMAVAAPAKTPSPLSSSAPAKSGVMRREVTGILIKVGKTYSLQTPAGTIKEIPVAISSEVDLERYIGSSITAQTENFEIVSLKTDFRPAIRTAKVVERPKTNITPKTVEHSWERHTLSGIFATKAILTAHPGDYVALFSSYDILQEGLAKLLDEFDGTELAWADRPLSSSQKQATRGVYGLIAENMGEFMDVDTVFPKNNNIAKSLIRDCLAQGFRTFDEFKAYFELQLGLQ